MRILTYTKLQQRGHIPWNRASFGSLITESSTIDSLYFRGVNFSTISKNWTFHVCAFSLTPTSFSSGTQVTSWSPLDKDSPSDDSDLQSPLYVSLQERSSSAWRFAKSLIWNLSSQFPPNRQSFIAPCFHHFYRFSIIHLHPFSFAHADHMLSTRPWRCGGEDLQHSPIFIPNVLHYLLIFNMLSQHYLGVLHISPTFPRFSSYLKTFSDKK